MCVSDMTIETWLSNIEGLSLRWRKELQTRFATDEVETVCDLPQIELQRKDVEEEGQYYVGARKSRVAFQHAIAPYLGM